MPPRKLAEQPWFRKGRGLWLFYQSIFVPATATSLLLLVTARLLGVSGNLLEMLWLDASLFGLILLYLHYFEPFRFYFYYNLGLSRLALFFSAFLVDAALFVVLFYLIL